MKGGFLRLAFAVWAVAFSCGVLFHEWQTGKPPWSIHAVAALAALAVILRPASVPRVMLLLGILAVELLIDLPNPWNHTVLAGVAGAAVVVWWLALAFGSRARALDPGYVFERVSPFLRVAFICAWYIAAFAKLNEGFVDTDTTCSVWILDQVPLLPLPGDLHPLLIAGTILVEFSIPTLLIFRRTRPLAIVIGFGFHFVSALGGHTAFSGFAWSFYLLFLAPGTLARAAVVARQTLPPRARTLVTRAAGSPLTWPVLAGVWLAALGLVQGLPDEQMAQARRWGAAFPYVAYALAWAWLLVGDRHRLLLRPIEGATLRFRQVVFAAALLLIVVNAASPYLGLKTRYSFTMYSNLQTEPGRWNHLIVPETVRVFDWQESTVEFANVDDERLARKLAQHGERSFVLLDARRLVSSHLDSSARYELDGEARQATPLRSDPVLGDSPSLLVRELGGFRPLATADLCQH